MLRYKKENIKDAAEAHQEEATSNMVIELVVKTMQIGKSAEADKLSIGLIKEAGVHGLKWLVRGLNVIWKDSRISTDWEKGIVISIFKKGSRRKYKNYTGITFVPWTEITRENSTEKMGNREQLNSW